MQVDAGFAGVALALVAPVALWIAWHDMARMRIPNGAVLVAATAFLLAALVTLPLPQIGWRIVQGAVMLAVVLAIWAAGSLGGGDAKYLAAMAPFVDRGDIVTAFAILAATLLAALATHRMARAIPSVRRALPGWKSWTSPRFPAGLGLSGALLLYLALGTVHGV